jgi:uncharacterized protein (DUF58 family)
MKPSASLLEQLGRSKILPVDARPSLGAGERLSKNRGAGMEFLDYRPYQNGDDTRHLDPHLYARTGEYFLRQYARTQQLPITIFIDLSPSVTASSADKAGLAREIAQVFGFVALAGGDGIQLAVPTADGLKLSPRWQGIARVDQFFDWIASEPSTGAIDLSEHLDILRARIPANGLIIAISDWWDKGIETPLQALATVGQELIAIQVLAAEEIDPSLNGIGLFTFKDAESGAEIELTLDAEVVAQYQAIFEARQSRLRDIFSSQNWHFIPVSTLDNTSYFFTRTLRAKGIIS